jgi:hypothetical protein
MLTAVLFIGNVVALAATVVKDRERHRSRGKLAGRTRGARRDARRVRAAPSEVETLRARREGGPFRARLACVAHPRLRTFFNGAVDELRAAYSKSVGAPDACKGSLRENGVKRAIEHSLPSIVRLYTGEIIDPFEGQSGQVDGILVHATGSALATSADDARIAFAEGVLAAIESKSNVAKQWDEVLLTWSKLRVLRRFDPESPPAVLDRGAPLVPQEAGIPLAVIGRNGWRSRVTLERKVEELSKSFGSPYCPATILVQLDPPGVALLTWEDETGPKAVAAMFEERERGSTLAHLWMFLKTVSDGARMLPFDWWSYFE